MPTYLFVHPDKQEEKEIFQNMSEEHVYVDEKGVEWKRVYTPANFSVDGKLNPRSSKEFVQKTKDKNYTQGDLQDIAKEASEKRKKLMGHDPVEKKWFTDYSKNRQGKKHPQDPTRYSTN